MSWVGAPIKLLHEAVGHTVTIELKSAYTYRGHMMTLEDNMNVLLEGVACTEPSGKIYMLDQVYLRGASIRYCIVPDMLRHCPMFKQKKIVKGTQRGKGQGKGMNARQRQGAGMITAMRERVSGGRY